MANFAQIMAGFAVFLKYAPYAIAGIQSVEATIGAGNGQTKQQLVVAGILTAVHAGEQVPVSQVQAISGIVDLVVGTLNASGLLGKQAPVAVTVPVTLPVAPNV